MRPTATGSRAAQFSYVSVVVADSQWQLSAVRRCAAAPFSAAHPMAPAAPTVACVHVPRGAAPAAVILAHRAARGTALARPCHDARYVGGRCCAYDKHQQLGGREGRAEPAGARVHADVVRQARPDAVLARLPLWLPAAARPQLGCCHKKWQQKADAGWVERCARRAHRRRLDASSWRTRRIQTESGAARARPRAAVAIWSYR